MSPSESESSLSNVYSKITTKLSVSSFFNNFWTLFKAWLIYFHIDFIDFCRGESSWVVSSKVNEVNSLGIVMECAANTDEILSSIDSRSLSWCCAAQKDTLLLIFYYLDSIFYYIYQLFYITIYHPISLATLSFFAVNRHTLFSRGEMSQRDLWVATNNKQQ